MVVVSSSILENIGTRMTFIVNARWTVARIHRINCGNVGKHGKGLDPLLYSKPVETYKEAVAEAQATGLSYVNCKVCRPRE